MDQAGWIDRLTSLRVFWAHDGNPKRPHALLTSGLHSNGFFNGSLVIRDPALLGEMLKDLRCDPRLEGVFGLNADSFKGEIYGSAMGATDISFELGRQLGCCRGYTEKTVELGMKLGRFKVARGTRVVVVEDTITTGGTTVETIADLEVAGAEVLPVVLCLCNRSGKTHLGNRQIVAVIDRELPTWDPAKEVCPFCAAGSEAVRPKDNWDRLTRHYD